MNGLSTSGSRQRWQKESHQEASDRINRERVTAPRLSVSKARIAFVRCAEDVIRSHQTKKHPHAKQSQPGEELNYRPLFHRPRHLAHSTGNLSEQFADNFEYFRQALSVAVG